MEMEIVKTRRGRKIGGGEEEGKKWTKIMNMYKFLMMNVSVIYCKHILIRKERPKEVILRTTSFLISYD